MVRKLTVAIWTIIVSVASCGVVYAQTASALVLETKEVNLPHLLPYSEIPSGMTVELPKRAKLVFLHYPTCRTVTVIGGTITFAEDTYTSAGGTTEVEARSECPRIVRLGGEYDTGGILLRGRPDPTLTLSPYPTFVLVGKRASDFAAIRVSRGGQELLTAPLDGRRFHWPTKAAPLTVGQEYELALVPQRAGTDLVTRRFKVQGPATPSSTMALTLLKVE
jgi:hypothetical protein